jgi:hypothetical protein
MPVLRLGRTNSLIEGVDPSLSGMNFDSKSVMGETPKGGEEARFKLMGDEFDGVKERVDDDKDDKDDTRGLELMREMVPTDGSSDFDCSNFDMRSSIVDDPPMGLFGMHLFHVA